MTQASVELSERMGSELGNSWDGRDFWSDERAGLSWAFMEWQVGMEENGMENMGGLPRSRAWAEMGGSNGVGVSGS